MNRASKKKCSWALMFFATSGLNLFHGIASANECPSDDFSTFLNAFSKAPEVQQKLTAGSIKVTALKSARESDSFEPQTTEVPNSRLAFPLMNPIPLSQVDDVEIEKIDDMHVNVIDKRAGNSNIKIFNFTHKACWVLDGMEDWSIREKDLSASEKVGMNRAETHCYQRGRSYANLAGGEQYRLTAELFEAALENYTCAAASGDPQASLEAASLSLSGMAPQLETTKVEALLKAAATTMADGAAALSTFYCYGNSTSADGACQHPDLAEKELIRAASMGSVDATNYLGYAFEQGEFSARDVSRAMACYRLAADKGNETAAANAQRLKAQVADIPMHSSCY
ncbi:lipoprotein [Pseudomonas cichorii]|uniref:tetratricopeptide repeat protein n=1 Tax=Pseudomonas cichorii TaxID=36746 RepID=UPI001910319F|nr:sel1 repeat family protein [Pseudomonas cichorii]GFM80205.1 lipoprotein [Pseudomonas cichorii]